MMDKVDLFLLNIIIIQYVMSNRVLHMHKMLIILIFLKVLILILSKIVGKAYSNT